MRASLYTTFPASVDIEKKVAVNCNNYFYLLIAHIQNRRKIIFVVDAVEGMKTQRENGMNLKVERVVTRKPRKTDS